MSGLTKEESILMDAIKHGESTVGYGTRLVAIIDRLLTENEELKRNLDISMAEMAGDSADGKLLQAKLDAIKKAWEPFMKRREDIAKCFKRPLADDTGIIVENQYFEALDRLIGGDK